MELHVTVEFHVTLKQLIFVALISVEFNFVNLAPIRKNKFCKVLLFVAVR